MTPLAKFLSEELKPYIQKHYRTSSYSILSGHSNSGRFVLDNWLNKHADFSQYFAFSPSLDDGYIVEQLEKTALADLQQARPLLVTMASEGEHMQAPFAALQKRLSEISDKSYVFKIFPNESHRTTKHASMQFALQTTFTGWQPSYEIKVSGIDALSKHYKDLSDKFGFQVDVPNSTLQKLVAHYAVSEAPKSKQALKKHIAFAIAQSPAGINSLFEIADYLQANNYVPAGQLVLDEICNQDNENLRCDNS
ncbi:hypothetical protein TUM4438_33700 [Shewanella sairae]|uniref:Uncharacterized protein n=1 Tax=Shewanella sairae TaxID=190310 RepID=A0ABQ4PN63_9GAMM|nr:hypothetical protein TUM4438_33700 [Shewanella sairae]